MKLLLPFLLTATTAAAQPIEVLSRADPPTLSGTGVARALLVSADGNTVFVSSDSAAVLGFPNPTNATVLYAYDVLTGALEVVTRGPTNLRAVSADGRLLVVDTSDPSLVPGVTFSQVATIDRATGAVALVSHVAGAPSQPTSRAAEAVAVSADGRFVLFNSEAPNLVPGQIDPDSDSQDVFLYDSATGENTLVSGVGVTAFSFRSGGTSLSPDGRWVGFFDLFPSAGNIVNVLLWDRLAGSWVIVSHPHGSPTQGTTGISTDAQVSADGAWVAFESTAGGLLPGGSGQITRSVFLFERATGNVSLVSHAVGATGTPANGVSSRPRIAADGSWVAYASAATDLVPGQNDANGGDDVFLFDRATGTTRLLSRSAGSVATTGNGACLAASLSVGANRVAFACAATDLVAGQADTNGARDLFAFDVAGGSLRLVSHRSGSSVATGDRGVSQGTLAATGWSAAFLSPASDLTGEIDGNEADDPFFVHLAGTETRRVTGFDANQIRRTANDDSVLLRATDRGPTTRSLGADGRYAVFESDATDLVPGQIDDPNTPDLFLFDQSLGRLTLVTRAASDPARAVGGREPVISRDGRFVAFQSSSGEVVPGQIGQGGAFLYDRLSGLSTLVTHTPGSPVTCATDGGFVTALSSDASFAVLESSSTELVAGQVATPLTRAVFVYERATGAISLASHVPGSATQPAAGTSEAGSVSQDGRFVAFRSTATDLVPGQVDLLGTTDIFLLDRQTNETALVSHRAGSDVATANGSSFTTVVSADGHVAFLSLATDLVAGQSDAGGLDAFLYERATGAVRLASHVPGQPATAGNGATQFSTLSSTPDGRYIAYYSNATNLVAGQVDGNGGNDLFLYDATTDTNRLVSHAAGSPVTAANAPTTPGIGLIGPPPIPLSDDGRRVTFITGATDIVPGGGPSGRSAYLFDAQTDSALLVSRTSSGQGIVFDTALSPDGNFVAFSDGVSDLVPGDLNRAFDAFLFGPVHTSTNLGVTLADSIDPIASGQAYDYSVSVGNLGSPATGVVLTVELPAGVSFQGSRPGSPTCVATRSVVRCELGTVAGGAQMSVTLHVTATLSTGVLTCRASVRAIEPDVDRSDDVAEETTTVAPADLALAMTGPDEPVPANVAFDYALLVTNDGVSGATGVTLVDVLPAGLAFVSSTPGAPACTHAAGVVTCALGTLAPAATADVILRVTPAAYTSVTNEATVSAATHDPQLANNTARITTAIAPGFGAELVHGSVMTRDLASLPGPVAHADRFRLERLPRSSWEVVVDGVSGDLSGAGGSVALQRLAPDGATVRQTAAPLGTGGAVRLAMENATAEAVLDEVIRVGSTGCALDCGPEDTYRIRARETTVAIPRFNNSASQSTVLLLQNRDAHPLSGHVWYWSPGGARLTDRSFALPPHASLVLSTAAIPGLAGTSGSITVSHDGAYGALAGKAVALEPATGFAFDTPAQDRPR